MIDTASQSARLSVSLPDTPPSSAIVRKPAARLAYIDGLRGLAIGMVMLRHFFMDSYGPGMPRWLDICGLGYLGVHLFLLLSGFCVAWAYVGPRPRPFTVGEFAQRRATRILPAYYVALLLFTLLALPLSGKELLWQTLTHLTMTHNLFPSTALAINGVFWSLALECQLYLLFPLFLKGFRRYRAAMVLLAVFAVQTAYRLVIAQRYGTQWDATLPAAWAVVGRMGEFALGVYAALLVGRSAERPVPATVRPALPVLGAACWIAGMAFKQKMGVASPFTDLAFSGSFFCLLLWASHTQSPVHRLLSWRPLVGLGVISYSVYLTHILPLGAIARLMRPHFSPIRMMLVGTLPTVAACILCGYLYFCLVERPAIDYFTRRRKAAGS